MTETQQIKEAQLLDLIHGVEQADEAWYNDIENAELREAYEDAKRDYRALETVYFANGFGWTCGRCGGSGIYTGTRNPGTCFNCMGSGIHPRQTPHKFQASPRVRLQREKEAREKRAAKDAALDSALRAIGGDVEQALRHAKAEYDRIEGYYNPETGEELGRDESFNLSMYWKLEKWGSLSEKQIAAVQRGIDRDKQRAAEAEALKQVEPLAEGRYGIEGEILTLKWQESQYGTTLKMLVKMDDGNKVWGTCPSKLRCEVGDRVRFFAQVERSRDDDHFGFYKRPTAAEKMEVAA